MATAANDQQRMERSGHYLLENQTVDKEAWDLEAPTIFRPGPICFENMNIYRHINIYIYR